MGRRGPSPSQKTVKVSANIPAWKYDILQALGIHTTYAINHGIDLFLEDIIQSGRVSQEGLQVYIKNLEGQITDIENRIRAANEILKRKEITQAPGQIRVVERDTGITTYIPASQFREEEYVFIEKVIA